MKKNRIVKTVASIIFISLMVLSLSISNVDAASPKSGKVDLSSGVLNVRNGPGTNYKKVGTLKDNTNVKVYGEKKGWLEIRYKNKKAYVIDDYVKIFKKMSKSTAKTITDKIIRLQRKTFDRNYTKKEVYSLLSPSFTKSYIDKFFKYDMIEVGKDNNGNKLYTGRATDFPYYGIFGFDWDAEFAPSTPYVSYYEKNNKEYLYISQKEPSEMYENFHQKLYLSKSSSKANWKAYKYDW